MSVVHICVVYTKSDHQRLSFQGGQAQTSENPAWKHYSGPPKVWRSLKSKFTGRDVSQLSRSPGGDPTNNDLPVRRRIDARMSACGRRTDNEVSHGTKFTEGSEAVGFLLLAPRGTKTGLSPSRTEGRDARHQGSQTHRPGKPTARC